MVLSVAVALLIILVNIQLFRSNALDCINNSTFQYKWGAAKHSVSCNSSYPTMVSCGYEGVEGRRDGGYIVDNLCYAVSGPGGIPGRPHGRCCRIPGDGVCVNRGCNVTGNDNSCSIYCPSGYELTGCTATNVDNNIDGIISFDSKCEIYSANENMAYGQARCCKSHDSQVNMSCIYISSQVVSQWATASCPAGYTITGCSGHQYWNHLRYVEHFY